MRRFLATLLLVALGATACSSSSSAGSAGPDEGSGPTTRAAASTASPATPVAASLPPGVSPPAAPDCFAMELHYANQDPLMDYVSVTVDIARGFGKDCPALAPGRDCFVPLAGSWRLTSGAGGALRVNLYENEGASPVHTVMFRPIGRTGQLARFAGFRYVPAKGVTKARFTVGLLDGSGAQVAITPEQILPMPTCDPRRRS